MRGSVALLLLALTLFSPAVAADEVRSEEDVYKAALALAAEGRARESIAMLQGAAHLSGDALWRDRMALAARLIDMRQTRATDPGVGNSANYRLAAAYLQAVPLPVADAGRTPAVLATLLPGAGHAWLGRWHDAGVAALMVWPMLILTLWAARRKMGPVTLFFALITVWLWSGTVFSAHSLSERTALESYMLWWQGLWQASALPGRPW